MKTKHDLRQQMIQQRDLLAPAQKKKWDQQICDCLRKKIDASIQTIHTFLPMGNEVNLYPVIQWALDQEITVVTPRAMKQRHMEHLVLHSLSDLEEGIYGTQHPANSYPYKGTYDVIIVPGLAFNDKGQRLGYGAGYYDRFLKQQPTALTIGVCYPFQWLEAIPTETHDMSVKTVCQPS